MTKTISTQQLREQLDAWFTLHFQRLDLLAQNFLATLRLDSEGVLELNESTKRRLKTIAGKFLVDDETVDGCGLIFAHSTLGTESGHLEWWVRDNDSRFARYSFGVVPGADRYYDYERLEWFIRSFTDGEPAIVGPYIDYLGVEEYVLTLTVPAVIGDRRIGAVGNDIQLKDLEAELLPLVLAHEGNAALLGHHGNVLFGNSSEFLPGEYVPADMPGYERITLLPEGLGLQLIYAATA